MADQNKIVPVEITHPSGLKFHLQMPESEVNQFNTDPEYASQVVDKYFHLYQGGFITAESEVVKEASASSEQEVFSPPGRNKLELTPEDEECLIQLVQERPPIYDFRLPLKQRSRDIIRKLWHEIIKELNVDMSVDVLAKKWKNIRDSFMRVRANINKKIASGSSSEEKLAAERLKQQHKNYDLLLFLDDTLSTRRTSSNLEEASIDEAGPSGVQTPVSSRPASRTDSHSSLSAQDSAFFDAIRTLQSPTAMTPTQNFCLRLADGLDKLPPRIRNQLQLEFLSKLTEMENKYVYTD